MLASSLGIHDLGLFIVSGLLLNITPGPDSLLIMSRSASHGWRAGADGMHLCAACWERCLAGSGR